MFQQAAAVTYNHDGFAATDSTVLEAQAHSGLTNLPSKTPGAYTGTAISPVFVNGSFMALLIFILCADNTEGALIPTTGVPISSSGSTLAPQVLSKHS